MSKPLVSVWCSTYNHQEYIAQAIQGFVMQKTNFEIEIFIHDDASTDNTANIIREYASKHSQIKPIYLTQNMFSVDKIYLNRIMLQKAQGKYIAICEGDDYWTDPLKLQKQVDFLEMNPNFTICWTKYKILKDANLLLPDWLPVIEKKLRYNIDLNNIFDPYATYTLTVIFRRSAVSLNLMNKLKHVKDNTLYYMCLSKGEGAILNFFSGVYRVHQGGMFSLKSDYLKNVNNYLHLKEAINKLPYCNNVYLNKTKELYLLQALNEVCSQPLNFYWLREILRIYSYFLLFMPRFQKMIATKTVIKHILLSLVNFFLK